MKPNEAREIELSLLNKRKISLLDPESDVAKLIRIWEKGKTETTPEGIKYRVTNHPFITARSALILTGFNQPIILVSGLVNEKERQAAAKHEAKEFQGIGHKRIIKREDPRMRKKILAKQTKKAFFWPRKGKH
jgi:hypothetical protein